MASLDVISAVEMGASSAFAIGIMAFWYLREPGGRWMFAAHVAWFIAVAAIGASGVLDALGAIGAPVFGLLIAIPMVTAGLLATRNATVRHALAAIPIPALIGWNAIRVLGVTFLILAAAGRIAPTFAHEAGWGDIIAGVFALPAMWALARGNRMLAWLWNSFGLLDLILALSLGVTSTPGSPLQIFHEPGASNAMTTLPWILIPAFLVPNLILSHLAVYRRLGRLQTRSAALA